MFHMNWFRNQWLLRDGHYDRREEGNENSYEYAKLPDKQRKKGLELAKSL